MPLRRSAAQACTQAAAATLSSPAVCTNWDWDISLTLERAELAATQAARRLAGEFQTTRSHPIRNSGGKVRTGLAP
jgi:hypothetical protein